MIKGSQVKVITIGAAALILVLLPLVVHSGYYLHILITVGMLSVGALGVRLMMNLGQWSFGQGAFMTLGAYASGLVAVKLGWSVWLSMPIGGLVAALFAMVIGYPALKVKAAYFAIFTIALVLVLRQLILAWRGVTGGLTGLLNVPRPDAIHIGALSIDFTQKTHFYYLMLILFFVTLAVMYRVDHSRMGKVIKGIYSSEDLAESVGINTLWYKVRAFAIGSLFAGLSGAFSAHYLQAAHPNAFEMWQSIYMVAYVIVGGIGSVFGPVVGTFALVLVVEALRAAGEYQIIAYGLVLIVVMLFLRGGLISLIPIVLDRVTQWQMSKKAAVPLEAGRDPEGQRAPSEGSADGN